MYTIITNNPDLAKFYGTEHDIHLMDAAPVDAVYDAIESALQDHFTLVTMPLPANVPTIRSPIRSVVLEKSTKRVHGEGLVYLSAARERSHMLAQGPGHRPVDTPDLRMIDLDQIKRAFMQIAELKVLEQEELKTQK